MLAYKLTYQIEIEKETTTLNAVGTPVESYAFFKKTFAQVNYNRGKTDFDDHAAPFTDTDFIIRYDANVNYKCRIKFDNEYFKILHIEKLGYRKDAMRLRCVRWDS